jgi:hypothetical protein
MKQRRVVDGAALKTNEHLVFAFGARSFGAQSSLDGSG